MGTGQKVQTRHTSLSGDLLVFVLLQNNLPAIYYQLPGSKNIRMRRKYEKHLVLQSLIFMLKSESFCALFSLFFSESEYHFYII